MSKVWPLLALAVMASMTQRAAAETGPLPIELTWDAPAGCPDASFVRRRIEHIARGPSIAPTTARASVERDASGEFHLALEVRTGGVEEARTIDAPACSVLAEAFAVVVALAIDSANDASGRDEMPSVAAKPPSPVPSPVEAHQLLAAPPKVAQPEAVQPANTKSSPRSGATRLPGTRLAFGLGGSLESGPLPQASGGVTASALLRLDRFRVGVLGTFSFRQTRYFDEPAGASFDMIDVGALAGYLVPLGIFALGPCANLEATHVQVRSFGIRNPGTTSSMWWTAVFGGRAEARITRRLGLFARADLVYPLEPPTFSLATTHKNGLVLHDPVGLGARFTSGIEIVIP